MNPPIDSVIDFQNPLPWPFATVLMRMGMAVAMGVLIGLEREHSQKTGVRTFGITGLLGCFGGLMGDLFAAIAMLFIALLVVGINCREMMREGKVVITTSASLAAVGFAGILFGRGHVFTPAVGGIITATLLAWKRPISEFALGLSDQELRSAILLAILSCVILPLLPTHPVDPWGLIEPRSNWLSVIIIAGLGFLNYILMKLLGPRGAEITSFFGGLVNSRKIIVELGMRLREVGPGLQSSVHRGILLATAAMLLRNGLIVALMALSALSHCIIPLVTMLIVNLYFWHRIPVVQKISSGKDALKLESPFKLSAALKFGLVFLILNVVGALAQRQFGSASFYFVSAAGGLLSSASSIASASTLIARHELSVSTGVNGIIFSTITSVIANIPLIRKLIDNAEFKRNTSIALIIIACAGLIAGFANYLLFR